MSNEFAKYVDDIAEVLKQTEVTDKDGNQLGLEKGMELFIDKAKELQDRRGTLFFCGNGASCTMAEHLSHDCFQNGDFLTMTCSETSHITAISNDVSYEDVYAYRIGKALTDKDGLIAISSSGNSPNIVKAAKTAREKGMLVVTITGMKPDNASRKIGDINFYVPAKTYGMVESAHATLLHSWLDLFMDKYMEGRH